MNLPTKKRLWQADYLFYSLSSVPPPEKVLQKIRKTIFGVGLNFDGIETKFLFHQICELYCLLRHNIFDEVVGLSLIHI